MMKSPLTVGSTLYKIDKDRLVLLNLKITNVDTETDSSGTYCIYTLCGEHQSDSQAKVLSKNLNSSLIDNLNGDDYDCDRTYWFTSLEKATTCFNAEIDASINSLSNQLVILKNKREKYNA